MLKERKKFLKTSFLFLLILISIILVLNKAYIEIIENNKFIIRKEKEWQTYKTNIENNTLNYAFFGDSHTRDSLRPKYIDNNSFNFATSDQDYREAYFLLKKILEKDNVKIKNIVLEIDTHTFSKEKRTKKRLFRELGYYSDFIKIKDIVKLKDENIIKIFLESKLRILQKGEEIIFYLINKPQLIYIEKGWTKKTDNFSDKTIKERIKDAEKMYSNHFNIEKELIENNSFDYFLKTLDYAKKNNISIIFIKCPMTKEYDLQIEKNNLNRKKYYQEIFKKINDKNIEYEVLDYYNYFFENTNYFNDAGHLNYRGAEIFSKEISNNLKLINNN